MMNDLRGKSAVVLPSSDAVLDFDVLDSWLDGLPSKVKVHIEESVQESLERDRRMNAYLKYRDQAAAIEPDCDGSLAGFLRHLADPRYFEHEMVCRLLVSAADDVEALETGNKEMD